MFARALLSKHLKKQDAKLLASNHLDDERPDAIQPLTAEQAQRLQMDFRQQGTVISPWRIIVGQLFAGLAVAVAVGLITGKAELALSLAYGVMVVVIPAALFARGLMSRFSSMNAITAGFGFFVWEALKIAVSIALIALAPRVVTNLDWLAMLIGLIITMKLVWVILWLKRRMKASRQPQVIK
ncbi:MAG TPA: ATP synthase subunit I [Burkholderiaceae bacterium]|nr:ATP synthase subunit I [Burkholderiaceae bacterium]